MLLICQRDVDLLLIHLLKKMQMTHLSTNFLLEFVGFIGIKLRYFYTPEKVVDNIIIKHRVCHIFVAVFRMMSEFFEANITFYLSGY